MPTKPRREDTLITLFLAVYEDDTWAGCKIDWLDQRQDAAVEAVAVPSDGRTLGRAHVDRILHGRTHRSRTLQAIPSDRVGSIAERARQNHLREWSLISGFWPLDSPL